jgi:hypothetical protein
VHARRDVLADDVAEPHDERPLVGTHDRHARQQPHHQKPQEEQGHQGPAQQAVEPARGDIEAQLVVDRVADRPGDLVGRGQEAQQSGIEGRPGHFTHATRAVEPEHQVQQRLDAREHHEGRHQHLHVADARVGADEIDERRHADGQAHEGGADGERCAGPEVGPGGVLGVTGRVPREDEAHRRHAQGDAHGPPAVKRG